MELCGLVVVDLREFREAPLAVVYRVLPRVFEARDEELARGAAPSPMSIDEDHYYFPQGGAREDFNKEVVEAVINKLTRLGRVRKMGVVFATHSPADLNDLVIQLTNTKIAMRSEPKVLERVDMAEYAGAYALAVAKSFIYTQWPSKLCRPRRGTEESSNPPMLCGAFAGGLPEGAGFCIPGGPRTRRCTVSRCGGCPPRLRGARRRYSQLCEEEGWEVRVSRRLRQQPKARRFPPGARPPPESSRGGGRVCGVSAVDCLKGLAAWRGGGAMPRDVLEFDTRWEIYSQQSGALPLLCRAESLKLLPRPLYGF